MSESASCFRYFSEARVWCQRRLVVWKRGAKKKTIHATDGLVGRATGELLLESSDNRGDASWLLTEVGGRKRVKARKSEHERRGTEEWMSNEETGETK